MLTLGADHLASGDSSTLTLELDHAPSAHVKIQASA